MEIRNITCKSALSSCKLPNLDYSLNPYIGCEHDCAYCYAPNVLRVNRNEWGKFVVVKENIPSMLNKELKRKKNGIVGISTVTDPYQPIEKKYKITRYCLEQLLKNNFSINIQTKSHLVIRDIDIISKFSNAEIMISIGTLNDQERKLLEPNSSSIDQRLKTIELCLENKIKTVIFFGPIYPTITENEITEIIDIYHDRGISEIMIDNLNYKPGIYENIESVLKNYPNFLKYFSKNQSKNKLQYDIIRRRIKEYAKIKKIKIYDAF
jgi:DNA repair photolyase